MTRIRFTTV